MTNSIGSRSKEKNRDLAIDFITNSTSSHDLKAIKKALKRDQITKIRCNIGSLFVDPTTKSVRFEQDWGACEDEVFSSIEILDIIENWRKYQRR